MSLVNRRFAFLLTIAILAIARPVSAQTFNNPIRIPTGQGPVSVFAVDLNDDGLPDLLYEVAGINSTPGSMDTLLAQPSGGYAPGPITTLPLATGACRPADLRSTGTRDLVCVRYLDECDSQIETLLGNGDGSFQSPIDSGVMHSTCIWSNFYPNLYAPADLNSDNHLDLTVGDIFNNEFFVLLGDGAGHFTVASSNLSNGVNGATLYAVDLNGDGKPDLVSSTGPFVYLGNGDGTFGSEKSYGTLSPCKLSDVESNGHPDAVCVGSLLQNDTYTGTNEIAILHNNRDGTFNPIPIASQTFGDPQGGNAAIMTPTAILDVNGDGISDILAYSSDGMSVLLGEPNLKFAPPTRYAVGNFGYTGSRANLSQVADLNGDGYLDVVATGASGLYISYGNKAGGFKAPPAYPVANLLGSMTVADFNGDGIPDIAATGDEAIELSLGKGDGTFQPPVALPVGNTSFVGETPNTHLGFNITHGDLRGIGRQDILVIGSPSIYEYSLYVLFNNGDGTFSPPQMVPDSSTIFPNLENFAVADFNGDHREDFLTTTTSPVSAEVLLSNGDGTFNEVTTALPNLVSGYLPFPAVADFNKDGKPDMVYVAGATAEVLKGHGDGSFDSDPLVLPIPPYQGRSLHYAPYAVATGDFDGDGNPDIAVLASVGPLIPPPSPDTNTAIAVYLFYGNGDGTFSAPTIAVSSAAVYDTVYAADVNKDGRDDLILEDTGTGATALPVPGNSVGVFLSEPGRLFGPEAVFETGLRGVATFAVDVDRDGYPDLLISNSSYWDYGYTFAYSNSVTELLNLRPQANSGLQPSNTVLAARANLLRPEPPLPLPLRSVELLRQAARPAGMCASSTRQGWKQPPLCFQPVPDRQPPRSPQAELGPARIQRAPPIWVTVPLLQALPLFHLRLPGFPIPLPSLSRPTPSL